MQIFSCLDDWDQLFTQRKYWARSRTHGDEGPGNIHCMSLITDRDRSVDGVWRGGGGVDDHQPQVPWTGARIPDPIGLPSECRVI